ncbi:MAG: hypothetical protein PHN56_04475 [Candidatus Nanoarchaeia archaeon]|nr:hypothetical protein [Candidatus Nanoarchaeia archaeon]
MDLFAVGGLEGITYFYIDGEKKSLKEAEPYLLESKNLAAKQLKINNIEAIFPSNLTIEEVIGKVYSLTNELLKSKGKALDVGYGLNTKPMNYFTSKGFEVSAIDIINLPDLHEQEHYNSPNSKNGINKLIKLLGGVEYLTRINGVKRYWGYFTDWNFNLKQDLIYFWGSWSSRSQNLTIGHTSKNYFYQEELNITRVDERLAALEYLIKTRNLKKAKQTLNPEGKLMIINPVFTKLGAGYLSQKDETIDYIELLKILSETGYKEVHAYGEFSKDSEFFQKNEISNPKILIAE